MLHTLDALNWLQYLVVIGSLATTAASWAGAYLPKPDPAKPGWYNWARAVIDAIAVNFGNSKNAP